VRRLKKNIDNNSIEKMFYYFSETNTANYKPQFDIQKVKDYEVILKNGKFKIYLFYSDSEKQINTVSFSFYINEKNQLKISELPKQKRKIVKLNKNKNSEAYQELNQLLKDYPENRQGLIKIPSDIMRRLAKEV
jgi:hypothetical protein